MATTRRQHHDRIAVVRVDADRRVDGRFVLAIMAEHEGASRRRRIQHGPEAPDVRSELLPVRLAHTAEQIGVERCRRSALHVPLYPSDHVSDTRRKARRGRRRVLKARCRAAGRVKCLSDVRGSAAPEARTRELERIEHGVAHVGGKRLLRHFLNEKLQDEIAATRVLPPRARFKAHGDRRRLAR